VEKHDGCSKKAVTPGLFWLRDAVSLPATPHLVDQQHRQRDLYRASSRLLIGVIAAAENSAQRFVDVSLLHLIQVN
jgi:hypothetical protein